MQKRDYLQKQLEELARLLGKTILDILQLRSEGKINEAYTLATESLIKKFKLEMDNILALSQEDFRKLVIESNTSNPVQLNYLAELLFTTGELLKEKNEKEKMKELFKRSFMIYDHLNKTERTFSLDRQEKMDHIKKELQK